MKATKESLAELFQRLDKAIDEAAEVEIEETVTAAKTVRDGLATRKVTDSVFVAIRILPTDVSLE